MFSEDLRTHLHVNFNFFSDFSCLSNTSVPNSFNVEQKFKLPHFEPIEQSLVTEAWLMEERNNSSIAQIRLYGQNIISAQNPLNLDNICWGKVILNVQKCLNFNCFVELKSAHFISLNNAYLQIIETIKIVMKKSHACNSIWLFKNIKQEHILINFTVSKSRVLLKYFVSVMRLIISNSIACFTNYWWLEFKQMGIFWLTLPRSELLNRLLELFWCLPIQFIGRWTFCGGLMTNICC